MKSIFLLSNASILIFSTRNQLSAYQSLHELLNRGKTELLVKNMQNELLIAHLMGSASEIANLALKSAKQSLHDT